MKSYLEMEMFFRCCERKSDFLFFFFIFFDPPCALRFIHDESWREARYEADSSFFSSFCKCEFFQLFRNSYINVNFFEECNFLKITKSNNMDKEKSPSKQLIQKKKKICKNYIKSNKDPRERNHSLNRTKLQIIRIK